MSLYLAVELQEETKKQLYERLLYLKRNCPEGDWEDSSRFHITLKFITDDDQRHEPVIDVLKDWENKCYMEENYVCMSIFIRSVQVLTNETF
jgi:2'-5' RNA ligase